MTRLVLTVDEGQGQAYELPTSNAGSLLVEIAPVPSGVPGVPIDVDATAAAVGSSGAAATADHKHHLAVGSPVAVALANADGLASTAARSDHVHALTAALASQVYAANWTVADWYIDGTVGNDGNNGTDPGTPLRTGAELCRRLGPYALWGQSVTVHVLANGMTDGLILRGALLVAGTHLDVIGEPTQLASAGTIATTTGIDHTIPRAPQVSCTGVTDWTPYVGARLRVTDTTQAQAVTWVAKANPAGAGLNFARVPRWSRPSLTSTTSPMQMVNPAVGATVVIESLPPVPGIEVSIDGLETRTSGVAQWPLRMVSVSAVDCPLIAINGRATNEFSRAFLHASKIGVVQGPTGAITVATGYGPFGCQFAYPFPSSAGTLFTSTALATACLFSGFATVISGASTINFFTACLFQATPYSLNESSAALLQDCQIFDVAGAASYALAIAGRFNSFGLSGSGNAGVGCGVGNNTMAQMQGTQNLQGAVANFQLYSPTLLNLTNPQFLQPSDYAQKGTTPAMVAGATTVTVPWYANTIQKVTATHAVFGGTPGILSVTQTSTTQFTITSSSALDTSTVNWQISPLGRNIFVSTS
jgi:hypothetical protein